jgi:4-pyridoxolactonase
MIVVWLCFGDVGNQNRGEAFMTETKVYLLDGGSLVIDRFHMMWNHGPAGEVRFPCYSVLVDHPEGRFIFDTGYDYQHVMKVLPFEKPIQTPAQTIPGALATIGLRPEDISHVINSHYHFDHCGGNKHLTKATTLCHKLEFEACTCPQPFEKLGYSDISFSPEVQKARAEQAGQKVQQPDPKADIYTPRFEMLKGDQEVAKGVFLFETPGHTAGHYSMMVKLKNRRPMLFTGDACYSKENMDKMVIASFHLDPVASLLSMKRLKDLAEKFDAEIFYSHDAESYKSYRLAPEHYS